MKIKEIREVTQPISSGIRNACIGFSKMTLNLVAVVTDKMRDSRRVGYGFHSNGRYGQGEYAKELTQHELSWYEEPGDSLDYALQPNWRSITTRRWQRARNCSRLRAID